METLRPAALARAHGLSAQAVRNYERDGFLPPAARTPSGYRIYTPVHAAALTAFRALTRAYGHATAGRIMAALHRDDPDAALRAVDRAHAQALRDRDTLDAVRAAADHLVAAPAPAAVTWSIGDLARHLGVIPATLRAWEAAGILVPDRDRRTGYRVFRSADVRDAELTHLLRRGGYPLAHIATVVRQVRDAGGAGELARALDGWQRRLTEQGLARLHAAARLDDYLAGSGLGAPGLTGSGRTGPLPPGPGR